MSTVGDHRERPAEDVMVAAPAGRDRRPRRRRAYAVTAVALVVAAGGVTAAFALAGRGGRPSTRATDLPPATAPITRGDVVDTDSVDGTLTYADERTVASGAAGVVTWAPDQGATITRGKTLLKVNNAPLTLMYGSLPLYRTLRAGVDDGRDVKELERNLKALGYGDGMTVDDTFTAATTQAVKDWQHDRGLPETGAVDASQVVFLSGAVRVGEVKAAEGTRIGPGGPALKVTGTKRIVHVDLDATKQDLARKGAPVTVELPDGRQVDGHISKVGTVATSPSGSGQGDGSDTPTVDVDVSLSKKGTGRLDQAPVTVDLQSERSKNVLSVPIEALLALREGGFGVEVVAGGTSRIVAVRTGTFGGGRVEISGAGLREGMKVGVPKS